MKNEIKEMLELHIKNEIDLLPKNQKKVLDCITNLQEENERLKLEKETIKRWYNLCKSRNEKAIEYIKQLEHSDWITFGRKILLEILNGGDEEC